MIAIGGKGVHIKLQTWQRKLAASQVNKVYDGKLPIIADGGIEVPDLLSYYLKDQPNIYVLYPNNQYWYWSQEMIKNIKAKKVKRILYVSNNPKHTVCPYFNQCHKILQTNTYITRHVSFSNNNLTNRLYVYECSS